MSSTRRRMISAARRANNRINEPRVGTVAGLTNRAYYAAGGMINTNPKPPPGEEISDARAICTFGDVVTAGGPSVARSICTGGDVPS